MNFDIADDLLSKETLSCPDLSHRVRKLGFFKESFAACANAMAGHLGSLITLDPILLTRAFLDWREDFMQQSYASDLNRRDYMVFSSGLMLFNLLKNQPIHFVNTKICKDSIQNSVIDLEFNFWPEGFIYTRYCLGVLESVLHQEDERPIHLCPLIDEASVWWSFRENVREDPARAIGVFDLFVGAEPNWEMPRLAMYRPAIRRAGRLLAHERADRQADRDRPGQVSASLN